MSELKIREADERGTKVLLKNFVIGTMAVFPVLPLLLLLLLLMMMMMMMMKEQGAVKHPQEEI